MLNLSQSLHSEGFRRQEPHHQEDDGDEKVTEGFLLPIPRVEIFVLTQLVHLFYQIETYETFEHSTVLFIVTAAKVDRLSAPFY